MDGLTACQRIRALERSRVVSSLHSLDSAPSSSTAASAAASPTTPPFLRVASDSTPQLLASHSPPAPHIPIFAVTASALLEDKRVCAEAGMDDVLVKPLSPKSLRKCLLPIVTRAIAERATAAATAAAETGHGQHEEQQTAVGAQKQVESRAPDPLARPS